MDNFEQAAYDVIIVGAGPAGLFTAYELVRRSYPGTVLVIDKGLSVDQRIDLRASGDLNAKSPHYVTHGEGGAGLFSDGKLSIYPAGSGLVDLLGESETRELYDYVEEQFTTLGGVGVYDYPSTAAVAEIVRSLAPVGIEYKFYPSRSVTQEQLYDIVSNMSSLLRSNEVSLRFLSEVEDVVVDSSSGGFKKLLCRAGDRRFRLICRYLVLAVGKAGALWLHRSANRVRLKRLPSPIEIGLRLEMPSVVLEPLTGFHNDMKLKRMVGPNEQVRTFCTNKGGVVAACKYRDITLVDGWRSSTDNTNFGLVTRLFVDPANPVEYGYHVARTVNVVGAGRPILQRLEDLINQRPTSLAVLESNRVRPTLRDCSLADINIALPRRFITNVMETLQVLAQVVPGVLDPDVLVYAPALELCWDKFWLDSHMQTSIEGLYVCGDTTGHVRGLVQAAATGVLAARHIIGQVEHVVSSIRKEVNHDFEK